MLIIILLSTNPKVAKPLGDIWSEQPLYAGGGVC